MKKIYANNFTTLSLGRQGENLARQVVFDLSAWEAEYGPGTAELIHQRPGDASPYPVAAVREGSTLVWTLTATDTAVASSYGSDGRCELRWYVGETLAKSKTWRTWVESALSTPSETAPPEPEQGWVDQIIAVGAAAKASAAAAKADADRAQGVIQDVNAAGSAAVQSVQTAGDAQVQRVTDEGATQTANAKAQADAAAQSAAGAAQSAQEAAESAAVYDTVVADVTQLKQDVAAITPDDNTVDGKPWTSKKIVDSLCQPFEENGNPVQCYPVENYPLGVKASWEPVQEGSGDPSPENIRPITGRDAVSVTRCGENLFNKYGLVVGAPVYGANGVISSYPDVAVAYLKVAPGAQYSIRFRQTDNTILYIRIAFLTKSMKFIKRAYMLYSTPGEYTEQTFTVTTDCEWIQFGMNNGKTFNYNFDVVFVAGGAPTTDEPYTGSTTDIALPETVYGGEVDAVSGEGQETWKMLTLDGTEKWGRQTTITPGKYGFTFQVPEIATPTSPSIKGDIVCNQYPTVTANDTYKCKSGISVEPNVHHFFRIYNDTYAGETIDSWKAYLAAQYAAGTPVQICYKLAEPVHFTATGTQPIPALSGVNTIYTDTDGVIVTGAEDPKHTITELKNAIISLGGNV